MDNQRPLLTKIVPMYEGIYPPETIEVVYLDLRNRIETLGPLVGSNEGKPLVTATERESYDKGNGKWH